MDWHAALGIIAGLLQVGSVIPYVYSMVRGTTRPNIITFILWGALSIIAILAQFKAGASWSIVILFAVFFNEVLIVSLCAIGYGYRAYGWIDWTSFVLGTLSIIGWQLTGDPVVALVLVTSANVVAAIPTVVKTYREPFSENPFAWSIAVIASVFAIASTRLFNTANLIFPIYNLIETSTVSALAFFGQRLRKIN